jgi:hypothetical protein
MSDESIGSQYGIAETKPQARSAPCGQISSIFRSRLSTSCTDVTGTRFKLGSAPSREPKFGDSGALKHAEMPRRTAIRTMKRVAITVVAQW